MNSGGLAAPAPNRGTGGALEVALAVSSGTIPSRAAGRRGDATCASTGQGDRPAPDVPSAVFPSLPRVVPVNRNSVG
jgi:hypothetical protein